MGQNSREEFEGYLVELGDGYGLSTTAPGDLESATIMYPLNTMSLPWMGSDPVAGYVGQKVKVTGTQESGGEHRITATGIDLVAPGSGSGESETSSGEEEFVGYVAQMGDDYMLSTTAPGDLESATIMYPLNTMSLPWMGSDPMAKHIGQRVRVTGTLESDNSIKVSSIEEY